jgi:biopolymer transport protein ExbD
MALKSRNKVSADFNMSSMTDIVFLLLIFFMLTSTLVTQNALELVLPQSSSKNTETTTLSVSIEKKDNVINYYIDKEEVEFEKLEAKLIIKLRETKDKGIVLNTDKSVEIEHVVKVMEIAYDNKFKLVLATSQEE